MALSIYIVIYLIGEDWQYLGYIFSVLFFFFCLLQAPTTESYKHLFIFNESILIRVKKAKKTVMKTVAQKRQKLSSC